MTKIYEYLGIVLKFWSKEHLPIHCHAFYKEAEIKIEFEMKNKKIVSINYIPIKGKTSFSPSKLKQLKSLVKKEQYEIIALWIRFFVYNEKIKLKKITTQYLKEKP